MASPPIWPKFSFSQSPYLYRWLPIAFFGLSVALFNGPYLILFPQGIHEWAQSDRLALAYGFFDHGFDFFHPRTFSLESIDAVVGVEFPLQSYLTALVGSFVGRQHLSTIFRLVDNVMLLTGCCYLFWLAFDATRSVWMALIPGAFLLTSTVFVYYAGNYLPDPFSASLILVAFYYIYRFYYHGRRSTDMSIGLSVAILAALVKLSAFIYLGSIASLLFTASYLKPQFFTLRQKVLFLSIIISGILLIGGWIVYMRWLNTTYAAWIFLAEAKPLSSQDENKWVLDRIRDNWLGSYLSSSGYWLLRGCVLSVITYAVLHWRRRQEFAGYGALVALTAIGGVLFYVLMGPQFVVHDYYMIMPAMPVAILLVLGGLISLHKIAGSRLGLKLGYIILLFLLLNNGFLNYRRRMNDLTNDSPNSFWARNGAEWLTQIGVPEEERILIISAETIPNVLLTHLQRTGLVFGKDVADLDSEAVRRLMTERQMRCIVMPDEYFKRVQSQNPTFLAAFRIIGSDAQRTVLRPIHPLGNW